MANIRRKVYLHIQSSHVRKSFICKHAGCGAAFDRDSYLAIHERIHMNINPYSCKCCQYVAKKRDDVFKHIRTVHFNLPRTIKEQKAQKIVDNRDPSKFIQEDKEQLAKRIWSVFFFLFSFLHCGTAI